MAQQPIDHSPETLGNLLFLIRRLLDDQAEAKAHRMVDDKMLIDIAAKALIPRVGRLRQSLRHLSR